MVFPTASGKVWLSASYRMTYLVMTGRLRDGLSVAAVRQALRRRFDHVPAISRGGAYLVTTIGEEGHVLFCVADCGSCAFALILPEAESLSSKAPLDLLYRGLNAAVDDVRIGCGIEFDLHSLGCETALLAS
ncbi:hypothetical protein LAZ40_04640 [Cereibacter sphaeroides]|uniref:hypothetical protein n=1 Tax=Cereibacter sphaeroides TaxID=1063 RepID=UPI001F190593|nr:hypothetical protein [Cereibacter sphaeroides]MCE6958343.1 hypothetical protein [Cereibacter sphaeroides]MCE6972210.1 hypothetical protein [Cereibacter sphaeroides]